mgnify:FL=1
MAAAFSLSLFVACNNKTDSKGTVTAQKDVENQQNSSINSDAGAAKLQSSGKPMVLDFNATWCGPCRHFAPVFEKVAGQFAESVEFKSIDIDENVTLANQFGVQAVPTVVFIDAQGNELNRIVGAPSEQEFIDEVSKLIK